jgi:hypothetical protein
VPPKLSDHNKNDEKAPELSDNDDLPPPPPGDYTINQEDFGSEVQFVGGIAQAITDLMCSPATSDSFLQDQRPLFTFIAQILDGQIGARLLELASEICDQCHDTITEIVADQHRVESRRERLERAREAKKRKSESEPSGTGAALTTSMRNTGRVPKPPALLGRKLQLLHRPLAIR